MEGHLQDIRTAIAEQAKRLAYEKKKQDEHAEKTLYTPFIQILSEEIAARTTRGHERFVEFHHDAKPDYVRQEAMKKLLGRDLRVPAALVNILQGASLTFNAVFETDMCDEKHYCGFRVSW